MVNYERKIQIKSKLNQLILEHCEEDHKKDLSFEGKSIVDDFDMDSVSLMALLVDIEESFEVSFDTTDNLLELLDDFDDFLEYLCELMETVNG
ncbi:MAG: hypothetical protein E7269_08335 [Lachnospiraceae bacterium]|nr:hypothetical protein [Lachnospiraceae bacterium]